MRVVWLKAGGWSSGGWEIVLGIKGIHTPEPQPTLVEVVLGKRPG